MEICSAGDAQLDVRLANLAARQQGVVALWQLESLGFKRGAVTRRVRKHQLHRRYRGVYMVGHTRISVNGQWMAAVLACGPDAVLSHGDAAALWDLRPVPGGVIHVTAPGKHSHRGVRCHTTSVPLAPQDRMRIDGIPVTSLSRTLLDIAGVLSHQRLRSTVEAAQRRGVLNVRDVTELLARCSGHRGSGKLRAVLAELHDEAPWAQSEAELRMLELIREADLSEPQCNVIVEGVLVDFYWPQFRLVVEVDGYGYHRSKRSFEDDRRRDVKLAVARIRTARFTRDRIVHDPDGVIRDLTDLIRSAAA